MANNVFANGREIACKAGSGKVTAAFPDVCFTPPDKVPPTPPGIPVPYPVTSIASDTNKGTKKVMVSRKEAMRRDSSNFKKCTGDNAAQTAKKGVINSKLGGKVYFKSWSMNVKIEGANAVRHLDLTTSNHGSDPANAAAPWPFIDTAAPPNQIPKPCKAACPRAPSDDRKKELRKKSPDKASRDRVNQGSPKTCAACKGNPKSLAADHIVPLDIIMQMPGFACLSFDNQVKVANTPTNYVGLCKSCNSSKCAKLWHRWTGNKAKNLDWTSSEFEPTRKAAIAATSQSIKNLKQTIKATPCG